MKFAIDSGLKEQILEQLLLTAPREQPEGLSLWQDMALFSGTEKTSTEVQDWKSLMLP